MEPFKVFIVFGQTGEYSDHNWPVRGFLKRDLAERFEFGLTKAAKEFDERRADGLDGPGWNDDDEIKKHRESVGDPGFRRDYTGTDYFTLEVEVQP